MLKLTNTYITNKLCIIFKSATYFCVGSVCSFVRQELQAIELNTNSLRDKIYKRGILPHRSLLFSLKIACFNTVNQATPLAKVFTKCQ